MARTKTTPIKTNLFTCVVCTTEKPEARHAATLECHPGQVCKVCLRTWFNHSHTCPVCRAEVTSHDAVSGSVADYERAKRRQERRRERVQRSQMQHDARLARAFMIQELLDSRLREAIESRETGIVVEYDLDQINWNW